jgi:STI1 domain
MRTIFTFPQIVSDGELSALLLDADFQQVLKDCDDPMKYHMHMSNPATAKKIQKMFNAGLVAKTN